VSLLGFKISTVLKGSCSKIRVKRRSKNRKALLAVCGHFDLITSVMEYDTGDVIVCF